MLSGNRNFPGRVHPDLELGFIMSPPLVIAFGLAGDAERDLSREPVQTGADGAPVFLRDLWPSKEEVEAHLERSRAPDDYARDFAAGEPQSALAGARCAGHAAVPVGPDIDRPAPAAVRFGQGRQPARNATTPGRCWSSATT